MKKSILIIGLFFLSQNLFCQNLFWEINKKINITNLYFGRTQKNTYSKNRKPELIGLSFYRENDSISYIMKSYDGEKSDYIDLAKQFKDRIKIHSHIFDKIASILTTIDPYELKTDSNIYHGITYFASFGNENYSVRMSSNEIGLQNTENDVKFKTVLDLVWENFK